MAEQELWRGEAAERYRIMDAMEEDRAAREHHALRSVDPREYRRRLDERGQSRAAERGAPVDHRGRGPKGYRRSDDRILEDVSERLSDDRHLDAREIQVDVTGGEITLTGVVESRSARRRAEAIAENVSGVQYVMNNLRVRQAGTSGATG